MAQRVALITGGSRGIGLEIARVLADEGYALTLTARRAEALEEAAAALRAGGAQVHTVTGDLVEEAAIVEIVSSHRERYGRLDVLVNNAGLGAGAPATEHRTKLLDLQLAVNLRAPILLYRECLPLLLEAGAEHRGARVINMSSIAGRAGQPWISVYSAAKAGLVAYTEAMNKEFSTQGVISHALCPFWVDTDMTEFLRDTVAQEDMLRPEDMAATVRWLLHLSQGTVVPEIVFMRAGDELGPR
ncbi:unannotated protein [freshwater metagenome]|jgi:NAD(P)-dependent dehydrogenase (short-subunit alcohol dehydrogenase family)|uniref:Unannotated protein n=1 Tax=freshwater metagenome TaxID=449393 RepID=A0A6J7J3Z3_9ZZZZ|nr:SDR family NAD(P)-dependent oxidoreductase [Actinomycetota bacterium]